MSGDKALRGWVEERLHALLGECRCLQCGRDHEVFFPLSTGCHVCASSL